ncbi:MAG: amino acid adenylation domain-containing protein, partial [Micromonosporaceae bacterium]|nr:amino acid adenylation domain-containing protein [Micromonosporaceae bacterium]
MTGAGPGLYGATLAYPEATVDQLVLATAARTPDALAVRQWDERLTYRELVAQAAAVAGLLRGQGIGRHARVGVCATRRPELVVTLLGVLLAGGCVVPLDPGGPRRRMLDIVADAGVRLVVGDAAEAEFGSVPQVRTLVPVPAAAGLAAGEPVPGPAEPDDIAYLPYTSGSTGRPKGVLATHRGLVEFIAGCAAVTGAGVGTRVLGISSLGFDAAVMDLLLPLVVGGSVQLVSTQDRADPQRLTRFIAQHRVDWGFITPSLLDLLDPAQLPDWRVVLAGGEAVPAALASRWAPGRRLFNSYGPTEVTATAALGELTGADGDPVPLGPPIPNHRLYIVDDRLSPVPDGEPGELLVGGPGVSYGYLNRPALTAERFVPDPFSGRPGERLYRTGDLVRRRADGRVVYLGRSDRQLKIRGQRVELGEIEAVLAEHPAVRSAAVEAVPGPTGIQLVAFVAPDSASDDELHEYAAAQLPASMRPARLLRLAALPVAAITGKLDHSALRTLATEAVATQDATQDEAADGADPVHRVAAQVWRQVLGTAPGPQTDFFRAGGDSIAAMRLVASLSERLHRNVATDDVLQARTFAGLVDRLAIAPPLDAPALSTGNPPTLSAPQRRLWFLDQLAPASAPYNIAFADRVHGELDLDALARALAAVAQRHDVLRWRVLRDGGVPYPVCDPPGEVPVPLVDLIGTADPEAALRTALDAQAARPIDLATGPAWQVTGYRLGPAEHVIAVTVHHAVFDGWSQRVFYRDLATAYAAAVDGGRPVLPTLPAGYADYAVWRAERDRRTGADHLAWWLRELAGAPTELELPRDRPRRAVQTYSGAEASLMLPPVTEAAVRALAVRLAATPAEVLLAGFGALLNRLTGAPEMVIGAVVADRRLVAFDEVVGFFIDTVPVRLRPVGRSFAELVTGSAGALRDASAHLGAPLERLVDALGLAGQTAHPPL